MTSSTGIVKTSQGIIYQSPAHLKEWIEDSGVSEDIAIKCFKTLTNESEIANLLGQPYYNRGDAWVSIGAQSPHPSTPKPYYQVKPREKVINKETGKEEAKYLGPTKKICPVDAILLPIRNWEDIVNDVSIQIAIAEGVKKAGALETCGFVSLAITGVENGLSGKKAVNGIQIPRELVPSIDIFAQPGRQFTLVFDSDIIEKKGVQKALGTLGEALIHKGCTVHIVVWDSALGKGIDDVLVAHGKDTVTSIMDEAMDFKTEIARLEKQFESSTEKKKRTPREIAREIAEDYKDTLLFDGVSESWMSYGGRVPGVWSKESDRYIASIIGQILDGKGEKINTYSQIVNVVRLLETLVFQPDWDDKSLSGYIPFKDGILDLKTGKLNPHAPSYRLSWALPRDYNIVTKDFPTIDNFLNEVTGGDLALKNILICFCNAVLKGRSDIQKFLHLIGPGGTGKGTFIKLLTDLIGERNSYTSTLEDWCSNRFESANAYQKKLIIFPDEDKKVGSLGKFKSLTGGDKLQGEDKGKKSFNFKFEGMVVVASNFPIFSGDSSSGIPRRVISVPFRNIPTHRDCQLHKKFEHELSGFTHYLLSLSDDFVEKTLLGSKEVNAVNSEFWASRQRTDSIAAWVNDCLIFDPSAKTPIGSNKHEGKDDTPITLYGAYCKHATESGSQSKNIKNFSPDLLELITIILGIKGVEKVITNKGKFIIGLRLRQPYDENIPTYEGLIENQAKAKVMGEVMGEMTGEVTAKSLIQQESDGCDGSDGSTLYIRSNTTTTSTHSQKSSPPTEEGDLIYQALMTARNKGEYASIGNRFAPDKIQKIYKTRLTKLEQKLVTKRCELENQTWTYELKINPDGTHSFIPRDI